MLSIDARLTLIGLLPLPLVSVSVKLFGSAIHRRFEQIQEQLSELSAVAQENLSGVRVVRAYGQEAAELERFQRANEEYIARNRGLIRLQGAFYPSMTLLLGFGALLVLWQGSRDVIQGRITRRRAGRVQRVSGDAGWPMIAFGWVTNMLQRGMASWKRMLEILDEPPSIADPAASGRGCDAGCPSRGLIEVARSDLHVRRPPGARRTSSVVVEPGQTAAIVGPTGSGKSTLLQLLPRLLDPPPGTVFIDGVDVRDLPLVDAAAASSAWRRRSRSCSRTRSRPTSRLRRRSRRCRRSARREVVERVGARSRGSTRTSPTFPKGFDTLVGERGITLSGGQKQRTALARALATDPRMLVLDDALSAVDTYTEEEILQRLRRSGAAGRASSSRTASRRSAMPISSSSSTTGASSSAGRTTSWSRSAARMRSCIASSCSKRSWKQ